MIVAGPFRRGQDISLRVAPSVGVAGDVTGLPTAKLKAMKSRSSMTLPGAGAPVAADCTVTPAAAAGDLPAGWMVTISATQSLALAAWRYVLDVRCVVGGGVRFSPPVIFDLIDTVSGG